MEKNSNPSADRLSQLRKQAEALIGRDGVRREVDPGEDVGALVQELFTYQIELELQNAELRQAQQELEQSRRNYVELYDCAPVGYLTVGESGKILDANLTACQMLGGERATLQHNLLSDFIVETDQDTYYRHRRTMVAPDGVPSCELAMRRRDGQLFYVQMASAVTVEGDGGARTYKTILTDISQRKGVEESLQRSRLEWRNTFDAMDDLVTIQDMDKRIVRANKATHAFFHVKSGELKGKHCYKLFQGVNQTCSGCPGLLTRVDGESHSADIFHEKLNKTFHVTCFPIYDEYGGMSRIVHLAKDITEQKKMEDDLFQARKMEAIGSLAGGIAHDFNNILSAIIGFAELAKDDVPEGSPVEMKIDQILRSSDRAANLVQQILTYSRKKEHQLQALSPHLIIEEVLEMLRSSLPSTILIHEDIDQSCGQILADPTSIHQVLMNLCTNALHAMDKGKGVLSVTLSCQEITPDDVMPESGICAGSFVVLSVSDTGDGMDDLTKERVFEPYFTTKETGKGTGMGLAVIHGIIRDYNGFIKVDSAPGAGSTFAVYLPLLAQEDVPADAAEVETTAEAIVIPTGSERILIVDDESMLVQLHERQLQRCGYTVTGITDSVEALEVIRAAPEQFDLLITDQTMPGLSGVELVTEVQKIRPSLPIILCTGRSDLVSPDDFLAMGGKRFMAKPVYKKELFKVIRDVLDGK